MAPGGAPLADEMAKNIGRRASTPRPRRAKNPLAKELKAGLEFEDRQPANLAPMLDIKPGPDKAGRKI